LENGDLEQPVELPRIVVSPASSIARVYAPRRRDKRVLIGGVVATAVCLAVLLFGLPFRSRSPDGTLVLQIDEPGASVQIVNENGDSVFASQSKREDLSARLPPGKYRLAVNKAGFEVFELGITIEPRAQRRVPVELERLRGGKPGQKAAKETPTSAPAPAVAPFDETQAKEYQRRWAEYLGVPVETTNSIGMKFVLIPPGEFEMGSSDEEIEQLTQQAKREGRSKRWRDLIPSEGPRHHIKITQPFFLGIHEVTVGQFRRFVDAKAYRTYAERSGRSKTWLFPGFPQGEDHPVSCVSWSDTDAFCQWLSVEEGKRCRLPSEAEWEYACRAGTTTFWSSGEEVTLAGVSNIADKSYKVVNPKAGYGERWDDGYGYTAPVGRFGPNPFGLYDMHGNLEELCADLFGERYYEESPLEDPTGPAHGSAHTSRGGFHYGGAVLARSARRNDMVRTDAWTGNGFRVVWVLKDSRNEKPAEQPKTADQVTEARDPIPAIAPFDEAQAKEHQRRWAEYLGVSVEKTNLIGMEFVLIPPGEFEMGVVSLSTGRVLDAGAGTGLHSLVLQQKGLPDTIGETTCPRQRVKEQIVNLRGSPRRMARRSCVRCCRRMI